MYTSNGCADGPQALPDNLYEALRALEASATLSTALGDRFVAAYLRLKQTEWRQYSSQVSAWEVEQTLDC
jgi:glutamine synthetase